MIAWVAGNWKWISVVGSIAGTGVVGAYTHVEGADERMDEIENVQQQMVEDVGDIQCMTVKNAKDEDPLDCLDR